MHDGIGLESRQVVLSFLVTNTSFSHGKSFHLTSLHELEISSIFALSFNHHSSPFHQPFIHQSQISLSTSITITMHSVTLLSILLALFATVLAKTQTVETPSGCPVRLPALTFFDDLHHDALRWTISELLAHNNTIVDPLQVRIPVNWPSAPMPSPATDAERKDAALADTIVQSVVMLNKLVCSI